MNPHAIIFDFDGVIADSEVGANQALSECLTEIGLPTRYEDSFDTYYGHNWQHTQRIIEEKLGAPLPTDFRETYRIRARAKFEDFFAAVAGASEFLNRTTHLPRAVASSSRLAYIQWALAKFELAHHFGDHVYSADGMARGKPHPDIYLKAAQGLGIDPARCLAIEDSPTGATAAVTAGMQVIGLCAASHIFNRDKHAASLRAVGVHRTVTGFEEIVL